MILTLKRQPSLKTCTHGDLYVNSDWECFTLEDVVRAKKVRGKTAIPCGTYEVIITHSPRFNRRLPLLVDVPNFKGVRIHKGNTSENTEGCILVGRERPNNDKDWISRSLIAFNQLFTKIDEALAAGDSVTLSIEDAL